MAAHEESNEHFFISFTDLLVGVIFLLMLLMMVFALNLKNAEWQKPKISSDEIRAELLAAISEDIQARGFTVTLDPANGILRLPEALLFESGQWELSPQGEEMIDALAKVLGDVLPCATRSLLPCMGRQRDMLLDSVLVEGHTDKRPFHNAQGYGNWELSAFRAITVYRRMLAANPALGVDIRNPAGKPILGVSAYAEQRPVDTTQLDPNRRIDIRFNMHVAPMEVAP